MPAFLRVVQLSRPTWLGWQDLNLRVWESKSHALPLGYTPLILKNGASGEIRTPDPRLRRAMLYPAELRTQNNYIIHK